MLSTTKIFGFGIPIKVIVAMREYETAHVFWKDKESRFLGCNDLQKQLIQSCIGNRDFIGKDWQESHPLNTGKKIIVNDQRVIENANTQYFVEVCYKYHQCLSIKTPLKNTANNIIGTMGIAFYFDEITLAQAANIISRLNFTPQQSGRAIQSVINTNNKYSFTSREKECIHHMLHGLPAREIGNALNISRRTVETHIENIKNKLGCFTRAQIISKILDEKFCI